MSLKSIRTVAVIGAGISGVASASHLLKFGLDVTLFERSDAAGGVWHFDEDTAIEPSYPNELPSKGDFERVIRGVAEGDSLTPRRTPDKELVEDPAPAWSTAIPDATTTYSRVAHAPPGPCYAGLKNNVPLTLMKSSLAEWPPGVEEFDSQRHLDEYIKRVAQDSGVNDVSHFQTRVENAFKSGEKWQIETTTWRPDAEPLFRSWSFDALVVATGHYHMPRVPDFPGLPELKQQFPSRVTHSKGYRRAEPFRDQTVLLVGAGTSSTDIAKELAGIAKHVYQSSRGGKYDHPASLLPENATRIGSIKSFQLVEEQGGPGRSGLTLEVHLHNDQQLCGIDHIIMCTGYVTSYPYLPQFHDDELKSTEAHPQVLVTKDGDMVHNLHEDIFYIEDPSLAFIGKPYHTANFSLFDFQAQIVARVYASLLDLPSREEMRARYENKVVQKGLGRDFHSLRARGAEPEYVRQLVSWANKDAERRGVQRMVGHTEAWQARYQQFRDMIDKRIELRIAEAKAQQDDRRDSVVLAGENVC